MTNPFLAAQSGKAVRFHRLHQSYFVIPTIWDPLSALAAQEAGFGAVATSSAAFGQSLGIRASERVPFDVVESHIARIATAVNIPVSIDMEDGYPEVPGGVAVSIARIIGAGVVAANIEDSWHGHARPLASADDHARRIETARRAADAALPDFFINARTDLFLQNPGVEPEVSVAEAVRRARLYVEAGANGVYITARELSDEAIAELTASIPVPVTLVVPERRSSHNWAALGVRRGSLGTIVIRNAWAAIQTQLAAIRDAGRVPDLPSIDIDAAILAGRSA
jgi:2-methylisocitrate lyase-like PEP mutase family enzyme